MRVVIALLAAAAVVLAACAPSTSPPAAAVAGSSPAAAPPSPPGRQGILIQMGYLSGTVIHTPVYIAQTDGFFARQGLDVTLTDTAGPAQIAALLAGDLQFATISSSELVNAALSGQSVVMVAALADYPMMSLYATPSIKTIDDLAGQSVGMGRPGTATDLGAQLFMRHFGLTDKTRIVAMGGESPAVLAGLVQGAIVAGVFAPPATGDAAKAGFIELINGPKLGVPLPTAGIIVTRSYLQQHADVVKSVLTGLEQEWGSTADPANRSAVIDAIAAQTSSSADSASLAYDYMIGSWSAKRAPLVEQDGISTAISLSTNPSAASLNPQDLYDNSVLQSIQP